MTYPTLSRRGTVRAPWSDLFTPRPELDQLFGRLFDRAADAGALVPAVDIRETPETIELTAELPGLRPEDVEVSVEKDVLTIAGEKKHEGTDAGTDANYRVFERRYGRFERSFTLPRMVDSAKIDARFENGVLSVSLPKAEEAKPRRIKVAVGK